MDEKKHVFFNQATENLEILLEFSVIKSVNTFKTLRKCFEQLVYKDKQWIVESVNHLKSNTKSHTRSIVADDFSDGQIVDFLEVCEVSFDVVPLQTSSHIPVIIIHEFEKWS